MSDSLTDFQRQEILSALFAGNKIQAIKIYRESTGLGLKESKDFIDLLEARLRRESPESFTASKAGCSCGAGVLVLAVVIIGVVMMMMLVLGGR